MKEVIYIKKKIMKIFKTKSILFGIVTTMVIITSLPMLQSCSDEDNGVLPVDNTSIVKSKIQKNLPEIFIDLDISNLSNLTVEQKEILKELFERVDPYVVYENHEYRLTIKNGNEINISDRLFKLVQRQIIDTNSQIKDLNVIQDKNNTKLLHVINKSALRKKVRFKNDALETYEPIAKGENGVDFRFYGWDLYLNNQTSQEVTVKLVKGAVVLEVAAIISANVPIAVVGAVVGGGAAIIGTYNQGNGVIITNFFGSLETESR